MAKIWDMLWVIIVMTTDPKKGVKNSEVETELPGEAPSIISHVAHRSEYEIPALPS